MDLFDLCRLVEQYGDPDEVEVAGRILRGERKLRRPRVARETNGATPGVIYFVLVDGLVVIGSTERLEERLREIGAERGDVLGMVRGGPTEEAKVLKAFKRWNVGAARHVHVPAVTRAIRELCASNGAGSIAV